MTHHDRPIVRPTSERPVSKDTPDRTDARPDVRTVSDSDKAGRFGHFGRSTHPLDASSNNHIGGHTRALKDRLNALAARVLAGDREAAVEAEQVQDELAAARTDARQAA